MHISHTYGKLNGPDLPSENDRLVFGTCMDNRTGHSVIDVGGLLLLYGDPTPSLISPSLQTSR